MWLCCLMYGRAKIQTCESICRVGVAPDGGFICYPISSDHSKANDGRARQGIEILITEKRLIFHHDIESLGPTKRSLKGEKISSFPLTSHASHLMLSATKAG